MSDGIANTILYLYPSFGRRSCTANFVPESVRYCGIYAGSVELVEGHLMSDHVHMCLSVAPKYSIAFVIGFLKGKSAVLIHRRVLGKKRVSGLHFWARGYCVSTVGLDEETIRNYIREQEKNEKEQLELEFDDE